MSVQRRKLRRVRSRLRRFLSLLTVTSFAAVTGLNGIHAESPRKPLSSYFTTSAGSKTQEAADDKDAGKAPPAAQTAKRGTLLSPVRDQPAAKPSGAPLVTAPQAPKRMTKPTDLKALLRRIQSGPAKPKAVRTVAADVEGAAPIRSVPRPDTKGSGQPQALPQKALADAKQVEPRGKRRTTSPAPVIDAFGRPVALRGPKTRVVDPSVETMESGRSTTTAPRSVRVTAKSQATNNQTTRFKLETEKKRPVKAPTKTPAPLVSSPALKTNKVSAPKQNEEFLPYIGAKPIKQPTRKVTPAPAPVIRRQPATPAKQAAPAVVSRPAPASVKKSLAGANAPSKRSLTKAPATAHREPVATRGARPLGPSLPPLRAVAKPATETKQSTSSQSNWASEIARMKSSAGEKRDAFSMDKLNERIAARLASRRKQSAKRAPIHTVAQNQPAPADSPFEIIDEAGALKIQMRRSRLLKTKTGVYRTAIVDPNICDVVQYTPKELAVIGKKAGSTHVTFWFEGDERDPVTYLVEVTPDLAAREELQRRYELLEDLLRELFPDSKPRLTVVADKLIVRGQAKDSAEAAQMMSIVRAQTGQITQGGQGGFGLGGGRAARVLSSDEVGQGDGSGLQVINMLHVPGVQQVALRVKIAELNRTAARGAGIDIDANIEINGDEGAVVINSLLNTAAGQPPALLGQVDGDEIEFGLRWLQERGVVRLVSEPTLVTLSGYPATFLAGGEFAVPTVVGTGGLNAVTTDFRAFGAIISFLPTVIDKDRIRLQVAPEFSQINQDLQVGNTPGLQVRSVTTTVEMREGQTLAIAGLLDESLTANSQGNLPWLDRIVGTRDTARNETELLILVTPELVHAMEPEEVPPLPGFDVTEASNKEFFWHGKLEGNPTREWRSTVWPHLKHRYGAGGSSMISGPFGHGQ